MNSDEKKVLLEVCCGSAQAARDAFEAGADRVELNSALSLGGLTPSMASFLQARACSKKPIICMVRERPCGFCYTPEEQETMLECARLFLENGADGIAFGFLEEDGSLDEEPVRKMTELIHSYGKEAVFHRALDVSSDPDAVLEKLCALGVDRVLSSGHESSALHELALERLARWNRQFQGSLQILPGCGINSLNVQTVLEKTGADQIHSSCKAQLCDPTTVTESVSFACDPADDKGIWPDADKESVAKMKAVLDSLSASKEDPETVSDHDKMN